MFPENAEQNTLRASNYLDAALDVGEAMLLSGAEISRTEDSIKRICLSFGAERTDVYVTTNLVVVSVYSHAATPITQTRRIKGMQYDLNRLDRLNSLSRRICAGAVPLDRIGAELDGIRHEKQHSLGVGVLIYALIALSFTLFFGGCIADAVISAVIAGILKLVHVRLKRMEPNAFLMMFICSAVGGFLAFLAVKTGLGASAEKISIGDIMLFIPGIALTNAIRDVFSGDTMSGLLRFIESLLLSLVVSLGFVLPWLIAGGELL